MDVFSTGLLELERCNWTFAGLDAGGHRVAILSLIETAKLHGIDSAAYLRCVIERVANQPVDRVDELLPLKFTVALGWLTNAS